MTSISFNNSFLQENIGSGLIVDEKKGDLGNSEAGKGEYLRCWCFVKHMLIVCFLGIHLDH